MARKPRRRVPKVPRSNIRPDRPTRESSVETPVRATASPTSTPPPGELDWDTQYAHVRRDLGRIALFGSIIFAVMFALRFVVGV